jgi:hypothetical protein
VIFYHIRIRDNFKIFKKRNVKPLRAEWFFTALKLGEFAHHSKIVYINNVACYLSASVIKSKTGKPELDLPSNSGVKVKLCC